MKKGVQIKKIRLSEDGIITVFDVHDREIKMTRKQRNLMRDLISDKQFHGMRDSMVKEFSNPHILCDEFSVICHKSHNEALAHRITTNSMITKVKTTLIGGINT